MATHFRIRVHEYDSEIINLPHDGPVEIGRQAHSHEPCGELLPGLMGSRLAIAPHTTNALSRQALLVTPEADGWLTVKNLGRNAFTVGAAQVLARDQSVRLALPFQLSFAQYTVIIEALSEASTTSDSKASPMADSRLGNAGVMPQSRFLTDHGSRVFNSLSGESISLVVDWLNTLLGVLQSAAYSNDFYERAAEALVHLVGLDSGGVVLCEDGKWKVVALATKETARGRTWRPSHRIIERLLADKRTVFQSDISEEFDASDSLQDVASLIASPLLDRDQNVFGLIYGHRLQGEGSSGGLSINHVTAKLVEVVAHGVATGLARQTQERAAIFNQVQFEQFFTPELARELSTHPELLKGKNLEVTLLFADIQRFSRYSEQLGPELTVDLVRDVMDILSDCAANHDGVLVDYTGDALLAMWGAPSQQPDHAIRACQAAVDMLHQLPSLAAKWAPHLHEDVQVTIGLNTGECRVGNTGSSRKFKYGPLGNTVNMASRVQGATKYLKTSVLMTESTRNMLGDRFTTRRLCRVRVVNIQQPVNLYELCASDDQRTRALCCRYEEALLKFEREETRPAAHLLGPILVDYPGDGPSLVLLGRCIQLLLNDNAGFTPEWDLPGK